MGLEVQSLRTRAGRVKVAGKRLCRLGMLPFGGFDATLHQGKANSLAKWIKTYSVKQKRRRAASWLIKAVAFRFGGKNAPVLEYFQGITPALARQAGILQPELSSSGSGKDRGQYERTLDGTVDRSKTRKWVSVS
jgi:hypothetical protein